MSSSAEAPKLKKYVIERNVDLSDKTRDELAEATQVFVRSLGLQRAAAEGRAAAGSCLRRRRPPPHIHECPPILQNSCNALRQVGTDKVQWHESYVCKDK